MDKLKKRFYRRVRFNEFICFAIGHKWKFPKNSYHELTDEEYEEHDKKTSHLRFPPNPYWPKTTSWGVKCVRCKNFEREAYHPFYKEMWWMVKAFFRGVRWHIKQSFEYRKEHQWRVWRTTVAVVFSVIFEIDQIYWGYFVFSWDWPSLPGEGTSKLVEWYFERFEE